MSNETYKYREEILDLRKKLLSAEANRLSGVKTYTILEVILISAKKLKPLRSFCHNPASAPSSGPSWPASSALPWLVTKILAPDLTF